MSEIEIDLIASIYEAYSVFKKIRRLPDNQNSLRLFKKFLDASENSSLATAYTNHEVIKKVNWLLGPHARTMYKIWEAQHEKGPTS